MAGTPYEAGGILRTVAATRAATDDELRTCRPAGRRCGAGTTSVEIKTGYGLTVATRARRAACRRGHGGDHLPRRPRRGAELADDATATSTSSAARCWTRSPRRPLDRRVLRADGAFDGAEARRVLTAGGAAGLELRVHGNQLGRGPASSWPSSGRGQGGPLHLPVRRRHRRTRRVADQVATLLPGVSLHPPALPRRAPAAGRGGVCRPGHRLQPWHLRLLVDGVGGRAGRPQMGLTPAEAVYAATVGRREGTASRRHRPDRRRGPADLAVLDAPSHHHLAYRPGVPLVRALEL